MKKRDARIDRLFKNYYKSKQPGGEEFFDRCEMPSRDPVCNSMREEVCYSLYQKKEPCPDLATLSAYVEGALSNEEQAIVVSHIEHCKECREKTEPASTALNEMREGRLEKTPEDLSSDTSSRISDSTRKTPSKE